MSRPEAAPNLAIVIPWRDPGDGEREANCRYVLDHYMNMNIGPVVLASDGRKHGQPFNRSAAYNRGYQQTGAANVILWNEADTLLPVEAVLAAANLALQDVGIVVPYTERHELDAAQTQAVHDGANPFTMRGHIVYPDGASIGQAGVTSTRTMDLIGGQWDEGFEGWGYDDNAMFHIFATLAGKPRWVAGKGVHLWHTPVYAAHTQQSRTTTDRNAARCQAIMARTGADLINYLATN